MHNIRIKVFRAIDELHLCQEFMEGHMNVLKIFGITEITTANTGWFYNPASYVLLAEHVSDHKVVGGVRVHVVGGNQPLPIEDAVGEMDSSIHDKVKLHAIKGSGELCGLWNAREVAGMGISGLLMRAGVSVTNQLNLSSLFALCAPITVPMVSKYGFVIEKSLGKDGTFYYPKSDLIATAVINNVKGLEHADPYERNIIFKLRDNPNQTILERGPKGEMLINYDLLIKSFYTLTIFTQL